MNNKQIIKYFGYGSNKDLDMMIHMVGRKDLKGEAGKLFGYELCIQKIENIRNIVPKPDILPLSPRDIIRKGFGDSFELYMSRPKADGVIYGTIWDLTPEEINRVKNWELVDFGMQEEVNAMAMDSKGNMIQVETQAVIDPPAEIDRVVTDLENYPSYIAPRDKMLEIADVALADYLKLKENS